MLELITVFTKGLASAAFKRFDIIISRFQDVPLLREKKGNEKNKRKTLKN
jgi:hypothetical protein